MLVHHIIFGSNLLTALLLICLAIPLIKGNIKPNNFYGIRTKFSFTSEKNWFLINQYGGKLFLNSGLLLATLSPCIYLINPENPILLASFSTIPLILVISFSLWLLFKEQTRLSNEQAISG